MKKFRKRRGLSYKKRVADINAIYDKYAKLGISNREIWRRYIYPVYAISEPAIQHSQCQRRPKERDFRDRRALLEVRGLLSEESKPSIDYDRYKQEPFGSNEAYSERHSGGARRRVRQELRAARFLYRGMEATQESDKGRRSHPGGIGRPPSKYQEQERCNLHHLLFQLSLRCHSQRGRRDQGYSQDEAVLLAQVLRGHRIRLLQEERS